MSTVAELPPKDVIFNKYHPMNPVCLLKGGTGKTYKTLNTRDVVYVKEDDANGEYLEGEITDLKSVAEIGNWIYRVKTTVQHDWRNLNDFKVK